MDHKTIPTSPKWSNTTKVFVTVAILLTVVALLIRFSNLIPTLVTAFIIAVLYHPIAEWLNKKLKISWGWSVGIIYLITLILLFGLITLGGIALISQVQGLITFLQTTLYQIPDLLEQLATTIIKIGPFTLDFTYINWGEIGNQLLTAVEPILARLGNIIGGIATGAFGFIGSFILSLITSFLLITETGGVRERILKLEIPGYQEDFLRLGEKINHVWNAFLRGQALVILIRIAIYTTVLGTLGLRYFIGMSLLAALGNFIPYIGVAVVWTIYFLVALFQGTTILGLEPFPYALLVMGVGWFIDNLYDSLFTPRIMGDALKLHPAVIMIAALIGLNLFGILGVLLAAPTAATLKILLIYAENKLTDKNPWIVLDRENEVSQKKALISKKK
jgi:predicted PurR-regulated permease PerM